MTPTAPRPPSLTPLPRPLPPAPAAAGALHAHFAEGMQYVVAFLRLGESAGSTPTPLDADSRDRMLLCLRVLSGQDTYSTAVSDPPVARRVWGAAQ